MKNNRKGFTLVELLAALVILGVLSMIAVPAIFNMMNNSRNELYVESASLFISKAEYQMRSSSSEIEKPDPGNCIILSLKYLQDGSITPPNDGTFLENNSFVIVKTNSDFKLEYAVVLVEEYDDTLKGVGFATSSDLVNEKANELVQVFTESDLIDVSTEESKDAITGYINSKNSGYVSKVEEIYHLATVSQTTFTDTGTSNPVFDQVQIESIGKSGINDFKAYLKLVISNPGSNTNDVKLYFDTAKGEECSYDTALGKTSVSYGNSSQFSKNFDFTEYTNKYDGTKVSICVVARNSQGGESRKKIFYEIYKNERPRVVMDTSKIESADVDKKHRMNAVLSLHVTDDLDSEDKLKVCLSENDTCTSYKDFNNLFKDHKTNYTFTCNSGSGCILDGQTQYLNVFVKDTYGEITKQPIPYTFEKNEPPVFTRDNISSDIASKKFSYDNDMNANIRVNITDDLYSAFKVEVTQNGYSSSTVTVSDYTSGDAIPFKVRGKNNGKEVSFTVKVTDGNGAYTVVDDYTVTVYQDVRPTITNVVVSSDGEACTEKTLCPTTSGGNNSAYVSFNITDDVDTSSDKLKVCLSLYDDGCSSDSDFITFTKYNSDTKNRKVTFDISGSRFDGSTRFVYVFVKDSFGNISSAGQSYTLYKNKGPTISSASVSSNYDYNSSQATLSLSASDDWKTENLQTRVCYTISGVENCLEDGDYQLYSATVPLDFAVYPNGEVITLDIDVKDSYDVVANKTITYTLMSNTTPAISNFSVSSKETHYNSTKVSASYTFSDVEDVDNVCIGTYDAIQDVDSDCLVTVTKSAFSGNKEIELNSYEFDGSTVTFYLLVTDSHGATARKTFDYVLYKACETPDGTVTENYTFVSTAGHTDPISATLCNYKCYQKIVMDGSNINASESINYNIEAYYHHTRSFKDLVFGTDCSTVEDYTAVCGFIDCFANGVEYYGAYGTKLRSGSITDAYGNTCSSYYQEYTVSRNSDKASLTNGSRICPASITDTYKTSHVEVND